MNVFIIMWSKASFVLHMRQLKEDNRKKLKQNAEWYGVHEGSRVEVQWAVWWVGEDLWWEGYFCSVLASSNILMLCTP